MYKLTIKTTNGETLKGYGDKPTEGKAVVFVHEEGGTAYLPAEEVEKVKIGAVAPAVIVKPNVMEGTPVQKVTRTPKAKKNGTVTLYDKVKAHLQANPELLQNRKKAIEALVAECGATEGGASTYFSKAKKELTS